LVPGRLRGHGRGLGLARALRRRHRGGHRRGRGTSRRALPDPADCRGASAGDTAAMIPLKDDVPSSSFPFVTIGLIVLNVLVFLYQASIGMGSERAAEAFIMEFGAVPCRVTGA